jgi:hypothetical protein
MLSGQRRSLNQNISTEAKYGTILISNQKSFTQKTLLYEALTFVLTNILLKGLIFNGKVPSRLHSKSPKEHSETLRWTAGLLTVSVANDQTLPRRGVFGGIP